MKKFLYLAIATVVVLCFGITTAQAMPPCYMEVCGPGDTYAEACCPEYVQVSPNCKGPRCKIELIWVCWLEPCDPVFLGMMPIFLPVPSTPEFTPANLQQSQLD
jgi:hypothetical protein